MKFHRNNTTPYLDHKRYYDAYNDEGRYLHALIVEDIVLGRYMAMVPNTSIGGWGTWDEAVQALTVRFVVERLS